MIAAFKVGVCRKCFAEDAVAEPAPVRFSAKCHKCRCDLKGKPHHSYANNLLNVFVRLCTDCYKPKRWISRHVCEERITTTTTQTWSTPGGEHSWTLEPTVKRRECGRQVDVAYQCRHATPVCSGCIRRLYTRKVTGAPRNGAACEICNLPCGTGAGAGAGAGDCYYTQERDAPAKNEEEEEEYDDEFEDVICQPCYEVCVLKQGQVQKGQQHSPKLCKSAAAAAAAAVGSATSATARAFETPSA
jgi:hypothetical protein